MRFLTFFFLAAVPVILLHAPAASAKTVRADILPESVEFKTDERDWQVGFQNQAGNQAIAEFVLPGESKKQWTEMVTINTFRGLTDVDIVKRYVEFSRKAIVEKCQDVSWNFISEKEESALYVWTARSCGNWPDQAEVVRALRGKEGLYVMHYSSRIVPMPVTRRDRWQKLFEEAVLTESAPAVPKPA